MMSNGAAASTLKRPSSSGLGTEPKRPSRNFDLCQYCRTSKKPCLPVERNWEAGEKCNNCLLRNLPCGPNLRIRGRRPLGPGCGGNVVGVSHPQPPASIDPYSPLNLSLPQAAPAVSPSALNRPSLLPRPPYSPIKRADDAETFFERDLFSQSTIFASTAESAHDASQGRTVDRSEPTQTEIIQKELNDG